ncbi:hypothetical protein [Spirulina major]|uniref:hypothetical protein n=1 Tax=Spirulina major TaxID=270636 RepID=UPI000933C055|nr:hypothetical protein [Spirulina major]
MRSGLIPSLSRLNWPALILFTLGFWLSGSLLLDGVVIPSLYVSGMMMQSDFASAGYVLFEAFNHLELICAACVFTACLALWSSHSLTQHQERLFVVTAGVLFAIALLYTYGLTPLLSSVGIHLDWLAPTANPFSGSMLTMQLSYWGLEVIKFIAGFSLVRWCYREMMHHT